MDEREKLTQMVKATTPLDSLDDLNALKVYYVNLVRSQEVCLPQMQPETTREQTAKILGHSPLLAPASSSVDCQVGSRSAAASGERYGQEH